MDTLLRIAIAAASQSDGGRAGSAACSQPQPRGSSCQVSLLPAPHTSHLNPLQAAPVLPPPQPPRRSLLCHRVARDPAALSEPDCRAPHAGHSRVRLAAQEVRTGGNSKRALLSRAFRPERIVTMRVQPQHRR